MKRQIYRSSNFNKQIKALKKKHRTLNQDIKILYDFLQENPEAGDEICQYFYKVRLKNSSTNKGKSGSFRVIYYYIGNNNNIYLLDIYSKSDQENIKKAHLMALMKKYLQNENIS